MSTALAVIIVFGDEKRRFAFLERIARVAAPVDLRHFSGTTRAIRAPIIEIGERH